MIKEIKKEIYYRDKAYTSSRIWDLADALAADRYEVNILRMPYCSNFPDKGRYCFIAQLTGQKRRGVDVCEWGRTAFEAVGGCLEKIHQKKGQPHKANDDFIPKDFSL